MADTRLRLTAEFGKMAAALVAGNYDEFSRVQRVTEHLTVRRKVALAVRSGLASAPVILVPLVVDYLVSDAGTTLIAGLWALAILWIIVAVARYLDPTLNEKLETIRQLLTTAGEARRTVKPD